LIRVDSDTLNRILRPGASSQEIRDILSEVPPQEQCPPNFVSDGGGGCAKNPFLDPDDSRTDEELEQEISEIEDEILDEIGRDMVETILRRGRSKMFPPRNTNQILKQQRRLKRLEKLRKKIERRQERRKRKREEPQVLIPDQDGNMVPIDPLKPPQRTAETRQPKPLEQQLPNTIGPSEREKGAEKLADVLESIARFVQAFFGGGGG
jgi:hypothetical protein